MGLPVRKQTDRVAGAAAKAINDSRRNPQFATQLVVTNITLNAGIGGISNIGATAQSMVLLMLRNVSGTLGVQYSITNLGGNSGVNAGLQGGFTVVSFSTAGVAAADSSTLTFWCETPCYHGDVTAQYESGDAYSPGFVNVSIAAPAAVDLPSSLVMVNQIAAMLNMHMGDGQATHATADTTNGNFVSSSPTGAQVPFAGTLAQATTLANQIKTAFNAHLTQSVGGVPCHVVNDIANSITTTNAAGDQTTLNTLLTQLKLSINTHFASAPLGEGVQILAE